MSTTATQRHDTRVPVRGTDMALMRIDTAVLEVLFGTERRREPDRDETLRRLLGLPRRAAPRHRQGRTD